jgi:hypothetical protein
LVGFEKEAGFMSDSWKYPSSRLHVTTGTTKLTVLVKKRDLPPVWNPSLVADSDLMKTLRRQTDILSACETIIRSAAKTHSSYVQACQEACEPSLSPFWTNVREEALRVKAICKVTKPECRPSVLRKCGFSFYAAALEANDFTLLGW